jgi:hypothetical protein
MNKLQSFFLLGLVVSYLVLGLALAFQGVASAYRAALRVNSEQRPRAVAERTWNPSWINTRNADWLRRPTMLIGTSLLTQTVRSPEQIAVPHTALRDQKVPACADPLPQRVA